MFVQTYRACTYTAPIKPKTNSPKRNFGERLQRDDHVIEQVLGVRGAESDKRRREVVRSRDGGAAAKERNPERKRAVTAEKHKP